MEGYKGFRSGRQIIYASGRQFFGLGLRGYCNPFEYSHKVGNAKYALDIMQNRKCKTKVALNVNILILLRLFLARGMRGYCINTYLRLL